MEENNVEKAEVTLPENDTEVNVTAESDAASEAVTEVMAEMTQKELDALREENRRLRHEDETRKRFTEESEELLLLFPEAQTDALPEEVKANWEKGMLLAAAYALWDKRRILAETNAEASNRLNAAASPGPVTNDGSGEGNFTLEEIKRMPGSEVRKYLERIYRSLEKTKNN